MSVCIPSAKKEVSERYYGKEYFGGKHSSYILGYGQFDRQRTWNFQLENILRYKKRGKLLDIGCAYGFFLKYASRYFDCYGIDVSSYAVSEAKKIPNLNIRRMSINSMKTPGKFDVITAFDILEHINNFENALKKIRHVAKKGSLVVIQMPILTKHMLNKKWNFYDKSHVSLWKEDETSEKIGMELEIIERYYVTPLSFIGVWPFSYTKTCTPFTLSCMFICRN